MKKMLLALIFTILTLSAQAAQVCDYNHAAHRQMEMMEKLSQYEMGMASRLLREAAMPFDPKDEVAKKIHLFKLKHASEKFVRHQYYKVVLEQMNTSVSQVSTLDDFGTFHGSATKAKFYLRSTSKLVTAWIRGMMVNTATMKNLKREIRSEIIEGFLKTLGQTFVSSLTDDELLVLTYLTDIGVKAGIEFTGQLLAGQAIRFGGTEMFLGWAGGPAGLALMIAPLFISGTLPEETRWTDLTQKYPELILTPERMIETSITKNPKRALIIHCWAWERRDYFMSRRADQIIANDQKRIENSIKYIQTEPYYRSLREKRFKLQADNTYVKPPVFFKSLR